MSRQRGEKSHWKPGMVPVLMLLIVGGAAILLHLSRPALKNRQAFWSLRTRGYFLAYEAGIRTGFTPLTRWSLHRMMRSESHDFTKAVRRGTILELQVAPEDVDRFKQLNNSKASLGATSAVQVLKWEKGPAGWHVYCWSKDSNALAGLKKSMEADTTTPVDAP